MPRAAVAILIALAAPGCDEDTTYGYPDAQDTAGDTPADTTTDSHTDSPLDSSPDTPADAPADTPTDIPADEGGGTDIEKFCTTVCDVCFGGTAPWNHQPADQCESECEADFSDCSPSDIPAILLCPGGDDCPAGPMGFGMCVAPYTCLLS